MAYYVYVLLCTDGSYYTGSAKSVKSRFKQHVKGNGARYTRMHPPQKIVHVEKFQTRAEAMKREKTIKRLTHQAKHRLTAT